jgi:hypothetical protein
LSVARRGDRTARSIRDPFFSRFEYFLAVFVVSASYIVVGIALARPANDISLSQPVVQGMIAIVSGVIGFYFGNRGAERAEEQTIEVITQFARGGPVAVQHERIHQELKEIRGKLELAIEQAQKASDLHGQASEASEPNRVDLSEQLKEDANKCFVEADGLIEEGGNGMKAWIITDHAWLRLHIYTNHIAVGKLNHANPAMSVRCGSAIEAVLVIMVSHPNLILQDRNGYSFVWSYSLKNSLSLCQTLGYDLQAVAAYYTKDQT